MRIAVFLGIMFCMTMAFAADTVSVRVADPYIELHTGPGRGYPIFHVVERGDEVEILKRRTDWLLVRYRGELEGWVYREQMERTLTPSDQPLDLQDPTEAEYADRDWEAGIMIGDFGGASMISAYGAFHLTENVAAELNLGHGLGDFSTSYLVGVSLLHQPFPEWRYSPYFTLGTGIIFTEPDAALVATEDRDNQYAVAGFGVKRYLSRRFLARAEYKTYKVFTSRNDNEEEHEWKVGVGFFF